MSYPVWVGTMQGGKQVGGRSNGRRATGDDDEERDLPLDRDSQESLQEMRVCANMGHKQQEAIRRITVLAPLFLCAPLSLLHVVRDARVPSWSPDPAWPFRPFSLCPSSPIFLIMLIYRMPIRHPGMLHKRPGRQCTLTSVWCWPSVG